MMNVCSKCGYEKYIRARGLCGSCYQQENNSGNLHKYSNVRASNTEIDAFLRSALAYRGDNCIIWPFGRKGDYGALRRGDCSGAHVYVCEAAHGPWWKSQAARTNIGKRIVACHNCGNSLCINPQHIRWDTDEENEADKIIHETVSCGEKNGMSKLHDHDIPDIVRWWNGGRGLTKTEIARRKGVTKSTIGRVINGLIWKQATDA